MVKKWVLHLIKSINRYLLEVDSRVRLSGRGRGSMNRGLLVSCRGWLWGESWLWWFSLCGGVYSASICLSGENRGTGVEAAGNSLAFLRARRLHLRVVLRCLNFLD